MKLNKNSLTLILGEFFDRLNFYGIQSVLLLYLIQVFLFSQNNAITIYGVYSSLGFISPIIGGYFADKFLSRHRFILLGIIFILIGDYFLLFSTQTMLLFGLGAILTGIGFFKSNNAVLFGTLYDQTPAEKDAAFTFYYAAMNAGAIAGPFIYGTLEIAAGWKFGFTASIVGFSISLVFYFVTPHVV